MREREKGKGIVKKKERERKKTEREHQKPKIFTVTDLNSHGCEFIKDVFALYSPPISLSLSLYSHTRTFPVSFSHSHWHAHTPTHTHQRTYAHTLSYTSVSDMPFGVFYIFANKKKCTIKSKKLAGT